ncbi:hypothetical protein D3C73_1306670 [compost metagenome]
MPASALHTGDPPLGLAGHQVGIELALVSQLDERQARIQQGDKHLITIARYQGTDRHGPLAHPPGAVPPLQQPAIASPMFIGRFSQHPDRTGYGGPLMAGILTPSHHHQRAEPITPDLEPLR